MKTFRFAISHLLPVVPSYIFVGITFGILINEAGYSVLWAFLTSLFIYAGSMQIIMISLMASGVSLYMIALMTLFVNGRHIFYGLGFINQFRRMGCKYPYMVLTLTDETYSVLCSIEYPEEIDTQKCNFIIALTCHLLWIFSSTLGALLGQMLPVDLAGIEFSATAFFVTVCVDHWQRLGSRIPAVTGFVSSIVFIILLGKDNFLIPSLLSSLVLLILFKKKIKVQTGGLLYDN